MRKVKLQDRFIFPVATISIVMTLLLGLYINKLYTNKMQRELSQQAVNKIQVIDASQRQVEDYCLSHAALFSQHYIVQDAYQIVHQGNLNDENDNKRCYVLV